MPFPVIFKKTTTHPPPSHQRRAPKLEEQKEKPSEKPKEKPEAQPQKVKKGKKVISEVYQILKSPHITEKATDLVKKNQYVFKIFPGANKAEIKKAAKELFGVDVLDVKIINIPPKRRRLGRISGWRKGYKKAIIKIKEGQKIEVLPR